MSPPARRGFGSVILQEMAQNFAAQVTRQHAAEGLVYELRIALGESEAARDGGAPTSARA